MAFQKGHNPWNKNLKGIHLSPSSEFKSGMIPWNKGNINYCIDCKRSVWRKSTRCKLCFAKYKFQIQENHPRWLADRNLLKDDHKDRGGQLHREWSNNVKTRDNWKCKIANQDCVGRIEAHHILGWSSYPELRYNINNGITLCHAHHPRKRAEEKLLIPEFQRLVGVTIV